MPIAAVIRLEENRLSSLELGRPPPISLLDAD
jgi:hypothetical protein